MDYASSNWDSEEVMAVTDREAQIYDKYLHKLMSTVVLIFYRSYAGKNKDGRGKNVLFWKL